MKRFLGFVILSGFVIMLGAAGGADFANMSFAKTLLLELFGMAVIVFGTSALLHYKRYLRRTVRRRRAVCRCRFKGSSAIRDKICMPERELC